MSPKVNEKLSCFLMFLVLLLTFLLAFMLHIVNQEVEPEVRIEYVEVPIEVYTPKQAPKVVMTEDVEDAKELAGPELYASYVDEITSEIYPDVDPMVVKAIIYQESRFIPDSVNSKSGTTGLMQISPKWHTERAIALGVGDLTDPYGNILVGCDILHELYQSYSSGYALNVYAGGYSYANSYIGSTSPYEKLTASTIQSFENGEITIGGD